MRKTIPGSKHGRSSPQKRGDHLELSPRVREMVDGLHEVCDAIEAGIPLEQAATVRPAPWRIKPPNLKAADIRAIRESLGLNQALFASFLGVRPATLRSWEQGETRPSPLARRFLDEIRDDPEYWLEKLKRRSRSVDPPGQASRKRRN
jgi:DNA-binding transcriptional regulator YiaG